LGPTTTAAAQFTSLAVTRSPVNRTNFPQTHLVDDIGRTPITADHHTKSVRAATSEWTEFSPIV
jgi:hypothetical protein